jgi:hypothetical protein
MIFEQTRGEGGRRSTHTSDVAVGKHRNDMIPTGLETNSISVFISVWVTDTDSTRLLNLVGCSGH